MKAHPDGTQCAAFAAALLGAAVVRETSNPAVSMALIWLPSGVAVAGLWLLGRRAVWIVALATLLQRLAIGYPMSVWLTAMLGATTEALVAVWLLRRCGLRGDFATLREIGALTVAAGLAPLGSMGAAGLGRALGGYWSAWPLHSGWDGWWRMNALGILTVVPLALTWLRPEPQPLACRSRRRQTALELMVAAVAAGIVALVMRYAEPGVPAMLLLSMVLPIALLAAVHFGVRAACTVAAASGLTITMMATAGIGAFQALPFGERHIAIQIQLLALVSLPLVFGALLAERAAAAARSMAADNLRQTLLRVMPDVVYRLRADDTFADFLVPEGNDLPVPADQFLGRRLAEVAAPADAARLLQQVANARAGRRGVPVEYVLATQQGRREREVRFVSLGNGEVLGVVRDVTARKHAERQLVWHAQMLERIAAGHDTKAVLTAILSGVESFLHGTRASLLLLRGKRLRALCAPSLPEEYSRRVDGITIGPGQGCCGAAAYENRLVVASDTFDHPHWAGFQDLVRKHQLRACWSTPVRSAAGTVLATFAIYHAAVHEPTAEEITFVERAALLTRLALERERREELLSSLQHNVSEGLFRSTADEGLAYANPACARLFGYASPAELLAAAAAATGDSPHAADLRWLRVPHRSGSQDERQLHRRDGSSFTALVSTTAVPAEDGSIATCDGAIADISQRKELEAQLRHSQKLEAVGQLAGGVAHDFNNLLTAITGYAESVHQQLPSGDPLRDDVGQVLRAADRAAALTRQLLAFGRRQVMQPRNLDLAQAVDELLAMLQRLLGESITLQHRRDQPGVFARVDRGQLEQVVLNLVLNARDAMGQGGCITLGTDAIEVAAPSSTTTDLEPGRYAVLWVADTGCGMTPEVRARAFDPFFTTKPPGKGSGLGLSTVYGIVTQSGGSVRLVSAPGQGTTVWVYLPAAAAEAGIEPQVLLPRPATTAATILVVEDEALVRDLVRRALVRAGHTVHVAIDGTDALQQLAQGLAPNLLITDVVMPRLGGYDLVQQLGQRTPRLPVLFISGYTSEGEDLLQRTAGPTAVLHKPFTAGQLLATIAQLLARSDTAAASH